MSCPYKNQSFMSKMVDKNATSSKSEDPEKGIPQSCPYSKQFTEQQNPHINQNKTNTTQKPETTKDNNKKEDEESEEEKPTGSCPVMNKSKII